MYYKDCANLSKLMIGSNFCVCNGYIPSYIEYFVSSWKSIAIQISIKILSFKSMIFQYG